MASDIRSEGMTDRPPEVGTPNWSLVTWLRASRTSTPQEFAAWAAIATLSAVLVAILLALDLTPIDVAVGLIHEVWQVSQ